MPKTKAQSNAEYAARRKLAGDKQATFWLRPAVQEALARMAKKFGSKDAAIEHCVLCCDQHSDASE